MAHIEKAATFNGGKRSFGNKYPGEAGAAIRSVTAEILLRLQLAQPILAQPILAEPMPLQASA
jgi:hypothetical protein